SLFPLLGNCSEIPRDGLHAMYSSAKLPLQIKARGLVPDVSLTTKGDAGPELERQVESQPYRSDQPDELDYGEGTQKIDDAVPELGCDRSEFLSGHNSAISSLAPKVHENPSIIGKAQLEPINSETPARGAHFRGDSSVSHPSSIASGLSYSSNPEVRYAPIA